MQTNLEHPKNHSKQIYFNCWYFLYEEMIVSYLGKFKAVEFEVFQFRFNFPSKVNVRYIFSFVFELLCLRFTKIDIHYIQSFYAIHENIPNIRILTSRNSLLLIKCSISSSSRRGSWLIRCNYVNVDGNGRFLVFFMYLFCGE